MTTTIYCISRNCGKILNRHRHDALKKKMKTNQKERRDKLGVAQLNIEIPENLHRGLKVVAAADSTTIRSLALAVLTDFYNRRKGKLSFNSSPDLRLATT